MALINDFLSLIYPRRCEACGDLLYRHERFICNYCHLNLPKSGYHLAPDNYLVQLFAGRVPLVNAAPLYLFEKGGKVQKLLHAIKYEEQKELAQYLGRLYSSEINETLLKEADLILPVPLHPKKLKARGFNRSEQYALGLAAASGTEVDTQSVRRIKNTGTQTQMKQKFGRWENVEGIFEVTNPDFLANKHILIVDDVITTGSTIEAMWLALKNVEGVKVSLAGIAFAGKI